MNSTPPLISVIIPTYNRAETIGRSVHSVLAQSLQDFEIIVVDDASVDDTVGVIESVADKRIRVLRHESNCGCAASRNTGMKTALGQYIAWLDSDDEWLPDKLQVQMDAMRKAPPECKAIYTAYEIVQKGLSKVYFSPESGEKRLFLGSDKGAGSTLLFERTLLDEIGPLDPAMLRCEDLDWLLRYSRKYRLLGIDQPLARVHYNLNKPAASIERSTVAFVAKYSEYLRQFGYFRNKVISKRWMEVASYYAQEANFRKMIAYIFKSISVYPFPPLNVWSWLVKEIVGMKISYRFMKR